MAAFFQMGHDTENLVGESDLNEFRGIVLSPVNRDRADLQVTIPQFRERGDYEIVLDPQLYFPLSERGKLKDHPYFPSDFDTADLASDSWWIQMVASLSDYSKQLGVDAVASPVVLPNTWRDEYFALCSGVSLQLSDALEGSGINTFTSVVLNYSEMGQRDLPMRIASIVSEAETSGYYLVIVSDVDPRRELANAGELFGVMSLIRELENTGRRVIVSHCSSDMVLFKAAGASDCATGKFFNLRRFTRSRYEEPASGGGQLAYWFEHSLMAFLRQADLARLERLGFGDLVGNLASDNEWANAIKRQFQENPTGAWVGLSWRQFLSWFGKTEQTITASELPGLLVGEWLRAAEANWLRLEDNSVLLDEPRNNGSWLRPWRQALAEFSRTS